MSLPHRLDITLPKANVGLIFDIWLAILRWGSISKIKNKKQGDRGLRVDIIQWPPLSMWRSFR
jgi:hypothetical protein